EPALHRRPFGFGLRMRRPHRCQAIGEMGAVHQFFAGRVFAAAGLAEVVLVALECSGGYGRHSWWFSRRICDLVRIGRGAATIAADAPALERTDSGVQRSRAISVLDGIRGSVYSGLDRNSSGHSADAARIERSASQILFIGQTNRMVGTGTAHVE